MDIIESYRGIPPGRIINRYLSKNAISQREFAARIGTHFQNLNSILHGGRTIPLRLSIAIDKELGYKEGTIAILQVYYEINSLRDSTKANTPHPIIRDSVFWDIDPQKLDWEKNKLFIINRVRERGNKEEIEQVNKYYG